MYMDQTGFDNRLQSPWGYCHRSKRLMAEVLGHRTERVSVMSAWWGGEVIAPMVYEGYTTSHLVCQWIEEWRLPEMLPGQILILDNASVHPPGRIRELLERAGCEVMFLPPYSPDLNKIEKFWARLKHQVKKVLKDKEGLFDAIAKALPILS